MEKGMEFLKFPNVLTEELEAMFDLGQLIGGVSVEQAERLGFFDDPFPEEAVDSNGNGSGDDYLNPYLESV